MRSMLNVLTDKLSELSDSPNFDEDYKIEKFYPNLTIDFLNELETELQAFVLKTEQKIRAAGL